MVLLFLNFDTTQAGDSLERDARDLTSSGSEGCRTRLVTSTRTNANRSAGQSVRAESAVSNDEASAGKQGVAEMSAPKRAVDRISAEPLSAAEILATTSNAQLAERLLHAMQMRSDSGADQAFLAALDNKNLPLRLRRLAVNRLANSCTRAAIRDALTASLEKGLGSRELRGPAMEAVLRCGGDRSVQDCMPMLLGESDPEVASLAVRGLQRSKAKAAGGVLEKLGRQHPLESVRAIFRGRTRH